MGWEMFRKGPVNWTGVLLHEIDVQVIKVIHQAYQTWSVSAVLPVKRQQITSYDLLGSEFEGQRVEELHSVALTCVQE